jgi:fibronectin type 3 domain-containing protein
VTLSWTPSSSSFAGFNIYRGSLSGGPYSNANSALDSTASYTDTSVASGQTYYYVVTEVDSTGAESAYSDEVSAIIP